MAQEKGCNVMLKCFIILSFLELGAACLILKVRCLCGPGGESFPTGTR